MAKRYYTTDKKGDTVEVSKELAKQLIDAGKKTVDDFTVEDDSEYSGFASGDVSPAVGEQAEKAFALRQEGEALRQKAEDLSKNPRMQQNQIGGPLDALGVGASRFLFPVASDIAERGGSEKEILGASRFELPVTVASMNPASITGREALKQGSIYALGSAGAREAGGDEASLLESGLGGAVPFAIAGGGALASKAGQTAKELAPNILHSVVVPKSGVMKGANPPDFKYALEQGDLIPKSGNKAQQIAGFEENIKGKVSGIAEERANLPEWKTAKVNIINGVFANAKNNPELANLSATERKSVVNAIESLRDEYSDLWGSRWKSVEDAMKERTLLNKESRVFSTDAENLTAKKKAKAILAQEIGSYVENVAPDVMERTRAMAPYMAMLDPVENANDLTRGKVVMPLGMTQAMLAGGAVGGPVGALMGLGASQLTKTPRGAQTLYDLGGELIRPMPYATAVASTTGTRASSAMEGKKKSKYDIE